MGAVNLGGAPAPAPAAAGGLEDVFGAGPSPTPSEDAEPQARMSKVCAPDKSGGVEIHAGFRRTGTAVAMELEFSNISCAVPVSSLAIQLNKNAFGLSPASQQILINPPVPQGGNGRSSVELVVTPAMLAPVPQGQPATPQIQVAIKNMATGSVFYFAVNFNLDALFAADGALDRAAFIDAWKSIDDRKELYGTVSDLPPSSCDIERVQSKFKSHRVYFIARRPVPNAEGQEVVYFSMRTVTGMQFLAELTFKRGVNACKICLKTESAAYGVLAKVALENLLRN
uniref:Beta-adaptin appendage C-terminal subdomain domain-containing protein n=1 Tax=Trieres chinensis TaxID=1514140 RepID=A0A7S2EUN0_TRICV|mmetsp:Transcript_3980/g.8456  ORF Transcript_3980/g.8456 Transcript_3980/m.8456 type:complete len:284 (+) Transcript_3980:3-854(+)